VPFGFGGDLAEGVLDCACPGSGDDAAPPLPELPAVGAELALPAKRRSALARREQERFDQVWDRATHEPKVDPRGPFEADRLRCDR
jgi:hypothetical protein